MMMMMFETSKHVQKTEKRFFFLNQIMKIQNDEFNMPGKGAAPTR